MDIPRDLGRELQLTARLLGVKLALGTLEVENDVAPTMHSQQPETLEVTSVNFKGQKLYMAVERTPKKPTKLDKIFVGGEDPTIPRSQSTPLLRAAVDYLVEINGMSRAFAAATVYRWRKETTELLVMGAAPTGAIVDEQYKPPTLDELVKLRDDLAGIGPGDGI